jgi:Phosphoglycerol transferase and related proteins, alkaline phosphatase superfamily
MGDIMMKELKKYIKTPNMILFIFAVKIITYYVLINVNILDNPLVLGSIAVFMILFLSLSRSNIKKKRGWFLILYSFFSVVMFADTMYYNYYNQTVSIRQIWQASNVAKVPSSFIATLIPASFILLLDIPFVYYYFKQDASLWAEKKEKGKTRKQISRYVVIICSIIILCAINPLQAMGVQKIRSVEFFTSHIADIYDTVASDVSAKEVPPKQVLKEVEENVEETSNKKLFGIAKGKNLIVIQIEAFQNFLLGATYNGQELTPNLNKLMQKDTLYFDHYYTNIGKGNTADAEFSTLNSLYPVIDGECYRLYEDNTYDGLPWLLKNRGYTTLAFHGNDASFWNRDKAYPYQGFDQFYSKERLNASDVIGLGISDKSLFRQTSQILKQQTTPYFAFIVTITNHHPFIIDPKLAEIKLLPEHEGTKFGSYLETAHYTDEAIGEFINELKASGQYDNTVIALYGDHHGLNCTMDNNDVIMGKYLGRTYDYDEMLNIPLIIHIPGSGVNQTNSTTGGQIDFLPTIANLMGFKIKQPYVLGQDLVNATDGFVAFTSYLFDGSFVKNDVMFEISREGIFEGSRAWKVGAGTPLDINKYKKDYEKAVKLKEASKQILDQNLISGYVKHKVELDKREN